MNNTAGGVRLGDDVIGVIEEMFLRLRFVLHGKQQKDLWIFCSDGYLNT